MIRNRSVGRPASGVHTAAIVAAALACIVLGVGPAAAQETDTVRLGAPDTLAPVPADSFVLVDSILEPDDTLSAEREIGDSIPADSIVPLPRLVHHEVPRPLDAGFAEGVYVWDRAALLRSTALTVADLIDRVPSLTRVRAGYYTSAEVVVSPFALTGDVEVLLDGYPLDPLTGTTVDLSQIGITDLERVRVERRGGRLRVELKQLDHPTPRGGYETSPDSGSAYTRVEIASGDLDTDGLAGVFLAPRFLIGPFALAISRLDSDGTRRAEPGEQTSAWLRWGALYDHWGVVAEYRRFGIEREEGNAFPGESKREEVIVRARVQPWEFFTTELYAGHSEVDDLFIDSVATELSGTHVGLRTSFDRDWLGTHAALRIRNGDLGPGLSYELAAAARPLPWVGVNGEVVAENWDDESAFRFVAGGSVGPFLGARAFVEVADGSHGIHWLVPQDGPRLVERTSLRAGVDWVLGGWRLGAAAFTAEADSVAPPAIPGIGPSGRRDLALLPGFDVRGYEVSFRVPLYYDPIGLEGWYTRVSTAEAGSRAIFQPVEQVRGGIVYRDTPLRSDQFEVELRVEGEYRGGMLAPRVDEAEGLVSLPASQRLNLDLSLRVLDIHAYVSWQNILNDLTLADLPDRLLPGQTAYFGVKWELWN